MKRFIVNVVVVLLTSFALLCGVSWYDSRKLVNADFHIPADIHKIVIGPSTSGCAINDAIVPGIKNLSRNGTALYLSLPLLPTILEQNPQIDTVYIAFGRFNYFYGEDNFSKMKIDGIANHRDFMLYPHRLDNDIRNELLKNPDFYLIMGNPDIMKMINQTPNATNLQLGFINIGERMNLHVKNAQWSVSQYERWTKEHHNGILSDQYVKENMAYTHKYLLQAIKDCKKRNVVPVLLFTPLYQYSRFLKWDNISDAIGMFGDDMLIADYEDFCFPDDSYYGDVHHLNYKGAQYFSEYLAKHGIECMPYTVWKENLGKHTTDEN